MSAPQLRARAHADRVAALRAREEDLKREQHALISEAEARIAQARASFTSELEAAKRTVAEQDDALDRELAAEMHQQLTEHARRFAASPRDTAAVFAAHWRAFEARLLSELGEYDGRDPRSLSPATTQVIELNPGHIVGAFLAARGDAALALFGGDGFPSHLRLRSIPQNALVVGSGAAAEQGLRELEAAVDRVVSRNDGLERNLERARVILAHASTRRAASALAAFDREANAEVQRQHAKEAAARPSPFHRWQQRW